MAPHCVGRCILYHSQRLLAAGNKVSTTSNGRRTFIWSRLKEQLTGCSWPYPAEVVGASVMEVCWWCDEQDDDDDLRVPAAAAATAAADVRWVCCSRANITCRSRWNWDMATLIRTLLKMIITDGTISVISVSALLIDVTRRTYFSATCSSSRISKCHNCWPWKLEEQYSLGGQL